MFNNKLARGFAIAIIALTSSLSYADFIHGKIDFTGGGATVTPNLTQGTEIVDFYGTTTVADAPATTLDFLSDVGSIVTFEDPWTVGAVTPLWSTTNFSFGISTITKNFEGDIRGVGIVTGTGFDATAAKFRFTTQGTDASYTFSATTVPEPASIALLGFGLAFIGMSRRKPA